MLFFVPRKTEKTVMKNEMVPSVRIWIFSSNRGGGDGAGETSMPAATASCRDSSLIFRNSASNSSSSGLAKDACYGAPLDRGGAGSAWRTPWLQGVRVLQSTLMTDGIAVCLRICQTERRNIPIGTIWKLKNGRKPKIPKMRQNEPLTRRRHL